MIEATELEYWASLGRLDRVKQALAANPDVNIRGVNDYTAMHAAAENGHLDVMRFLAEHGAELSPRVDTGETLMELAMLAGQQGSVELLRSLGATC